MKLIDIFMMRPRPAIELAASELEEAKRKLLVAQTGLEFATSEVAYQQARIKRLTEYLGQEMQPAVESPEPSFCEPTPITTAKPRARRAVAA